nr:MAG TPA: hypothetical protein [Caudoviricetes sp.]
MKVYFQRCFFHAIFQVTAISKTLKTTVYADYMRSIFQKGGNRYD